MWFDDVFLQSVFQRAGVGKAFWLSQKQTAVCTKYMQRRSYERRDCCGEYAGTHHTYFYSWCGRSVQLEYSKLNGCGSICFGPNLEEQEKQEEERKKGKARIEAETIARAKRHPAHLQKRIENLKKEEENCLFNLSFDDNDEEDKRFYTEKLNECRRLLFLYQN